MGGQVKNTPPYVKFLKDIKQLFLFELYLLMSTFIHMCFELGVAKVLVFINTFSAPTFVSFGHSKMMKYYIHEKSYNSTCKVLY